MKITQRIVLTGIITLATGIFSHKSDAQNVKTKIKDVTLTPYRVESSVISPELSAKLRHTLTAPTKPTNTYTINGICVSNMPMDYAEYIKIKSIDGVKDKDAVLHGYEMNVMVYNIDTDDDGLADKTVISPTNVNLESRQDLRGERVRTRVKEYENRGNMPISHNVAFISLSKMLRSHKGSEYQFNKTKNGEYQLSGRVVAQNYASVWNVEAADWGNDIVSYGGDVRESDYYKVLYFLDVTGDGLSDIVLAYNKKLLDKSLMFNLIGYYLSCNIRRAITSDNELSYYIASPVYNTKTGKIMGYNDGTVYIYNYENSALKNKIEKPNYDPSCVIDSFITPEILEQRIMMKCPIKTR